LLHVYVGCTHFVWIVNLKWFFEFPPNYPNHILKIILSPIWLTLVRDVPGGGAEFVCSNMQSWAIGKNMTANS
jgi:hypothetical protein